MKAYIFSGQGSQKKGMGQELFREFKDLAEKADSILGYSLKDLCSTDPDGKLSQTQYTQPALFAVNALAYLKYIQSKPVPDFTAGHSLGEYNALFASGAIDFETGLRLVKKRGELMSESKNGGMAAVLGLDEDKVRSVLTEGGGQNISVANYNTPYQIVLSGLREELVQAEAIFQKNGATLYKILNVSGAFHTRFMGDAKKKFAEYVKEFTFSEIRVPVISNLTARPYRSTDLKHNIIEQITNPVRWSESIRYLMAKGVEAGDFEEISGGTLSIVKPMAMRIAQEAGPLDLSQETEKEKKDNEQAAATTFETAEMKRDNNDESVKTMEKPAINSDKPPIKIGLFEKMRQKRNSKGKPGVIPAERPAKTGRSPHITAESLGNGEFKTEYGMKYACLSGGMYKGIASATLVAKMGKAGFMGFYGTGGQSVEQVEDAIHTIQKELAAGEPYGINVVANPFNAEAENAILDLALRYGVRNVEAAAYMTITPSLVCYKAKGLKRDADGSVRSGHRILAKVSRPEVAGQFLDPAPGQVIVRLLESGKITQQEADLLKSVPVADELIVEADSGGHTDQRMPYTLMPGMLRLRDEKAQMHNYGKTVRIGAAGGIGTPEAMAASFILGADFVVTGSINQCTVEAGTSDAAKDLLEQMDIQDTDYAPAGDLFELGARVQVLKRGVFFPARANRLYELYRQYDSLDAIDSGTRKQLEEKYFNRSLEDVYADVKAFYPGNEIEHAEKNPKCKMALVFKWYFGYSTRLALNGDTDHKINFQIQCGSCLGAFNRWVKGTDMEQWRNRHVDQISVRLMEQTALVLSQRYHSMAIRP